MLADCGKERRKLIVNERSTKLLGDIRHLNEDFIADPGNMFGISLQLPLKISLVFLDRAIVVDRPNYLNRIVTALHYPERDRVSES